MNVKVVVGSGVVVGDGVGVGELDGDGDGVGVKLALGDGDGLGVGEKDGVGVGVGLETIVLSKIATAWCHWLSATEKLVFIKSFEMALIPKYKQPSVPTHKCLS